MKIMQICNFIFNLQLKCVDDFFADGVNLWHNILSSMSNHQMKLKGQGRHGQKFLIGCINKLLGHY